MGRIRDWLTGADAEKRADEVVQAAEEIKRQGDDKSGQDGGQ